jgi:hypothetical protein
LRQTRRSDSGSEITPQRQLLGAVVEGKKLQQRPAMRFDFPLALARIESNRDFGYVKHRSTLGKKNPALARDSTDAGVRPSVPHRSAAGRRGRRAFTAQVG